MKVILNSNSSSLAFSISNFGSTTGTNFSLTIVSAYLASTIFSIASLIMSPVPYFFSNIFLGTFPCLKPSTFAFFTILANASSFALVHSSPLTL